MKSGLSQIILLLILLPQLTAAKLELWQTTWNAPTTAPTTAPAAPWKPAMWTCGATNASTAPDDIKDLARLCRYGGACKKMMPESMYNYLKYYDRLEIFSNEKVPAGTLLIADSEGSPTADGYPAALATSIRAITRKYAQYPCSLQAGDVAADFSFGWTSQMREIDLYCTTRMWKRAQPRVALDGDYVMLAMYLSAPESQDQQFRSWSLLLNSIRREQPDKKILALIQGGYAWPITGSMTDDERHRLARFVVLGFDGVWVWGIRDKRLTDDLADLATDPLHRFTGEAGWGVN